MERQVLGVSPPEAAGHEIDRQTSRLFEAACSLLADAQQSAVAIDVTVSGVYDGCAAESMWLYGKSLARQHGLRASACLRGHTLTVCFKRQRT